MLAVEWVLAAVAAIDWLVVADDLDSVVPVVVGAADIVGVEFVAVVEPAGWMSSPRVELSRLLHSFLHQFLWLLTVFQFQR